MDLTTLQEKAIGLLKDLIALPSPSGREDRTADRIETFLREEGVTCQRTRNNVWARNRHFDAAKPTLLLNSHHDTVAPNPGWTLDPYTPLEKDGKLYGLGSNDAGAPLVSLLATFLYFYHRRDLPFNLIIAATAEEENSGPNGIERVLPELERVDFAIVGEPTRMQMAIAEKGLVVLDCTARGEAGHAAHGTGRNAIDVALRDIQWLHRYRFPRESKMLGPVRMTVTIIQAGSQHNVIPDTCHFTVDVRTTDAYTNEEVVEIIQNHLESEVRPRSLRLRPSYMPEEHPLVRAARQLGIPLYGSPTTSDQALIPAPSVKLGPGDSLRSHTADEFVEIDELSDGIRLYIALLERFSESSALII